MLNPLPTNCPSSNTQLPKLREMSAVKSFTYILAGGVIHPEAHLGLII